MNNDYMNLFNGIAAKAVDSKNLASLEGASDNTITLFNNMLNNVTNGSAVLSGSAANLKMPDFDAITAQYKNITPFGTVNNDPNTVNNNPNKNNVAASASPVKSSDYVTNLMSTTKTASGNTYDKIFNSILISSGGANLGKGVTPTDSKSWYTALKTDFDFYKSFNKDLGTLNDKEKELNTLNEKLKTETDPAEKTKLEDRVSELKGEIKFFEDKIAEQKPPTFNGKPTVGQQIAQLKTLEGAALKRLGELQSLPTPTEADKKEMQYLALLVGKIDAKIDGLDKTPTGQYGGANPTAGFDPTIGYATNKFSSGTQVSAQTAEQAAQEQVSLANGIIGRQDQILGRVDPATGAIAMDDTTLGLLADNALDMLNFDTSKLPANVSSSLKTMMSGQDQEISFYLKNPSDRTAAEKTALQTPLGSMNMAWDTIRADGTYGSLLTGQGGKTKPSEPNGRPSQYDDSYNPVVSYDEQNQPITQFDEDKFNEEVKNYESSDSYKTYQQDLLTWQTNPNQKRFTMHG